jgi:hypothetical protein
MVEKLQDNDKKKFAIVLTGTITPNSIMTTHSDTMVRRQEYLNAVKFYTKFAPVFFLENSCYSLDKDKEFSEIQNLYIRKTPVSTFPEKGKGYQEFEMIDIWLCTEKYLPEKWIKVSGRYIYQNFEAILHECLSDIHHQLIIDQLYNQRISYTVLFFITTSYYNKYIKGLYHMCDDKSDIYIEKVLFQALEKYDDDLVRIFREQPSVEVVSGSNGIKMNDTKGTLIYFLRNQLRNISTKSNKKYIVYPLFFSKLKLISIIRLFKK